MREILFRGKSAENGRWYVGNLSASFINKPSGNTIIHKIQEFNYSYADENEFETTSMSGFDEIVIPGTVGQYTGLTDKYGNKIFEGDIVKDGYLYGKVVYATAQDDYDGMAGFMVDDVNDGLQNYNSFWNQVKVIGNIHDNPELLKGSGE